MFLGILAIQIQSVAVSWQIYSIARSPMALGYVGLFQFIPMMAFTLPAGHIADRFDRRMILALSYLVEAGAAGLFLALAIARPTAIWPFYATLALFGAARAFAGGFELLHLSDVETSARTKPSEDGKELSFVEQYELK